jgi:radical SAM protein with 4Fe4S-binding SPASM domain
VATAPTPRKTDSLNPIPKIGNPARPRSPGTRSGDPPEHTEYSVYSSYSPQRAGGKLSSCMEGKRIQLAVWEITLKCNLACNHCGSRAGTARPDELTTAEALDVVRQLDDVGTVEVVLIGGEAFLRPDWHLIATEISRRGMMCTIVTGGRGVTADLALQMRDCGVAHVAVSIDGLEATHDSLRALTGSYAAALAAVRQVAAARIPCSVNTQISRKALPELEEMAAALVAEEIYSWRVGLTVAMGRAADRPEMLLQPYDLLDLFPRLARLKVYCEEHGVRLLPDNSIGYFGPYETLLRADSAAAGHWTACAAGDKVLGIESDGTLKGCPSLPTAAYAGGNLRTTPLVDLLDGSERIRFTRDRTIDDLWGFCRSCPYADVCRGGCSWTTHVLFGRRGNNPYCHYRALFYARKGLRERVLQVARAPGLPFDHGQFALILEPMAAEGDTCGGENQAK